MEVNIISSLRHCFAQHCELCQAAKNAGDGLCLACRKDLPFIRHACLRCGVALWQEGVCGKCMQCPPCVDRVIAPLAYRYPVTEIIKNIKYNQRLMLIPVLTSLLVEKLSRRTGDLPALLLPVPLSYRRWIFRGFNQSIEICKSLRGQLKIPFDSALVRRRKNTPPLYPLDSDERTRQLKGAFAITGEVPCRSVAIVDDVVTTGSTVNEMALLLRNHGAEHIEVWSLARTC